MNRRWFCHEKSNSIYKGGKKITSDSPDIATKVKPENALKANGGILEEYVPHFQITIIYEEF